MIKKDAQFQLTSVEKEAFYKVKAAPAAPALHSPDFGKYFSLYTLASDHSLAAVLTQRDEHGIECPI